MDVHIKLAGIAMIVFAAIHVIFPRYFHWKDELSSLSLINRQLMYVHTFFIGLVLLLMGMLCLTSAVEILTTTLGKHVALGLAVFWSCRLVIQFVGYSSELWRGKAFETTIHILFALVWFYFSTVFFLAYLHNVS